MVDFYDGTEALLFDGFSIELECGCARNIGFVEGESLRSHYLEQSFCVVARSLCHAVADFIDIERNAAVKYIYVVGSGLVVHLDEVTFVGDCYAAVAVVEQRAYQSALREYVIYFVGEVGSKNIYVSR